MKKLAGKFNSFLKNPIVSLFTGAFLGAFFGYLFTFLLQAQEISTKREVLFSLLRDELPKIASTVPPYDPGKAFYRDPIRIQALALLLDGQTLDYSKAPDIARRLLILQVDLTKYNDFVLLTNQAQANREIPDSLHEQWYRIMAERHATLVAIRDEVLKVIVK